MTVEEVQKLAPTLYLILFSIVLLNMLTFLSYYLQERKNKHTKNMFLYWAIQALGLGAAPFFQKGNLIVALPLCFNAFTIYYFYKGLFANYARVPSYRKHFIAFFAVGWPMAFILEALYGNFVLTTLPLTIALAAPALEMIYLVVWDGEKRFRTLHHKWAVVGLGATALHALNFSFFRMDPSALIWGTTGHILIVVMFGIVITNFHTFMLHKSENERLETLVGIRTRELKQKLQLVEKLKDENDRLFKVVLHDISNPMSAVLGYLSLLGHSKIKMDPAKRDEYVGKTVASAESVASTIRQVRALATAEMGKTELGEVELWDALELAETIYEPLYEAKGVTLDIQYPKNHSLRVRANKELFVHSVLGNLLSNSLKFSEPGSTVKMSHWVSDGKLHLKVRDRGTGIKEDQIPRLFSFERSVTTTGTKGERGTGYGLPLMKRYIDQIHGKVYVESAEKSDSAVNHGTSFHLEFDLLSPGPRKTSAPSQEKTVIDPTAP